MIVRWGLTQKGIDTIPILMMVAAFCSMYEAEKVFVDKRLRKLHELFNRDAMELVRQFLYCGVMSRTQKDSSSLAHGRLTNLFDMFTVRA